MHSMECEAISTKGDVYSFGVLLLQLITGCSPTDEKFNDGISLHEFVDRAFTKNIHMSKKFTVIKKVFS